jgi:hypothetical protein
MGDVVELEIGLHRQDATTWAMELRCTLPKEDQTHIQRGEAAFDLEALGGVMLDATAYGRHLTESLFGPADMRDMFQRALGTAETYGIPLRLRLFIGRDAGELQGLRWETLQDPGMAGGAALLAREDILFSRYLDSLDWRPVTVRPESRLRAVVVVANPTDLASYQPEGRPLAPIDVDDAVERARQALGDVSIVVLGQDRRATFERLRETLRDPCDVLLIVAHGALVRGEPLLFLEKDDGVTDRIPGGRLVASIREMMDRPRLVLLASCQSAGNGATDDAGGGVLAALGPRLAAAGVPAVLAMQGNISMDTADRFLPVFFTELRRDGQIDRAVSVARSAISDRPDWWMPALFMRLRSGRIWYRPGFADEGFDKWPAILADLRAGNCTPILGPGLTDTLLGTRQELARRWAQNYNFPLATRDEDDLPQVAQYLSVNLNQRFPRQELSAYVRKELIDRYGEGLSEAVHQGPLDDLITAVGERVRAANIADPHRVLAALPFPIYLTAHPANLLGAALVAEGKEPAVELCPWKDDFDWPESIFDRRPDYRPDIEHPLVFHLFGRIGEPDSLVLTEDDYFDYLIGLTSNRDLIPDKVKTALTNSSLLFLGFRMDEWEFRVLFRSIMNQEGRGLRKRYTHVAVQIDPEESRTIEPERARRYLETYFDDAHITIYWGSVGDFLVELDEHWRRSPS